jgi:exodeoxyribonuclease V beta subunit
MLVNKESHLLKTNYFDPVQSPLYKGINLIEASAGTGKTYAIAMLVLRFVVEHDLKIDQLLVVTFTKAATEELKDRVRARLSEAKRVLDGRVNQDNAEMQAWLESLQIAEEVKKQRLNNALLDLDRAGVFTIHGFCQRVLREHALESGQLFDAELTDDLTTIKQACADDFWRRQIYTRTLSEVAVLTATYKSPQQLLDSVKFIADQHKVYQESDNLDTVLNVLQVRVAKANDELDSSALALRAGLAEQTFKVSFSDTFELNLGSLSAWLKKDSVQVPSNEAITLFTESGLSDALNGQKFRANKTQSSEQRKADYLADLAINSAVFDALSKTMLQVRLVLRRMLLETLREELDKRLQQLNAMSFDNLISRLAEALAVDKLNGGGLIIELRQRFAVALIDEFQDTDNSQWSIFSSLFATPSHYLYLIGDPKQAIYKFRGADIYSYLSAQQQAEHRYTLNQNWRSHPQLVMAVNRLFQREHAFLLNDLSFNEVQAAKTRADGELQLNGQVLAPMMLWQLARSDTKSGYWSAGKAADQISVAVINEIVALLSDCYRMQPDNRPLLAKDIAILVRTNNQARAYQAALRGAGVPSVLNNTESVFSSEEACDLYVVLKAVANPGDSGLLKQAMNLNWFAFDGIALYKVINDEIALDAWLSRFAAYYQLWQKTGLMAMMQQLLAQETIRPKLATGLLAERRLTNIHQLIELLQQAAVDEHLGVNKTLDWLGTAITLASSSEEQQLRLESDEDAVKIVTMHRSKGLEYSVVFCPCLWQRSDRLKSEQNLIQCHVDGQMIVDLGSDEFEQHRTLALDEELAEDCRMFYVAVTRAKYRCYLVWADERSDRCANDSSMAWLLEIAEQDFDGQQALLQSLVVENPLSFIYQCLEADFVPTRVWQHDLAAPISLSARERKRSLFTHWQMSSYTALSALSQHDAPEWPEDKAREPKVIISESEATLAEANAALSLPRGTVMGNVVHELLENCTFSDLAEAKDISVQQEKACQRYGLKLEQPEQLVSLLQAVVSTPLSEQDSFFCLMNLDANKCLKEMPFYLTMQTMDASQINAILQDTAAYQSLDSKLMCGYLTGFIDLICEYKGLYYLMDYKTTSLSDYKHEQLIQAMYTHNYGLQYWLYTVVLHRYLQQRLPHYDYESHFGGVRYLFVRGMHQEFAMSGVFQDRPDFSKVKALAALFAVESDA